MINFFVLSKGQVTQRCFAINTNKAVEIIKLLFPGQQAYVVEDNKISFAQNVSIEEAEVIAGIKPMQSIVQLPASTIKATKKSVKKTKMKSKVKATKKSVKKTKMESKVKATKKSVKKTKMKSKVKAKKKKVVKKK